RRPVSWRPPAPKQEPPARKRPASSFGPSKPPPAPAPPAPRRPASSFEPPVPPTLDEDRAYTREKVLTSEAEPEGPAPAPPKAPQPEVPQPESSKPTRLRVAGAKVLRRFGPELGVFGIFLVAAAVITWPVVQHIATAVPGNLTDS